MRILNIWLLLFFCSWCYGQITAEAKQELFDKANNAFRDASSDNNDISRRQNYEQAAVLYERLIADGGIHNAKLYYNLGNAYFLGGNLGKAILNYNRAIKYDRYDANIHKNLAFARSKAIDKFGEQTRDKIFKTIFFWHYDFSIKTRYVAGAFAFGMFCIFAGILFLKGKSGGLIALSVFFILIAGGLAGSAATEDFLTNNQKTGVITAVEVIARQGDGLTYTESFKEPLHEATEFILLEERGQWLHIQLSDGSDCWITKDAAELID